MKIMCEQCLELFDAEREDARYCTPPCRQMAYRDRKRMRDGYVDLYPVCRYCGERVDQEPAGRQKEYCKPSCRTMAYRKRKAADKL